MTDLVIYLAAEERRIGTTVEVLRQALLVSVPRLRNAATYYKAARESSISSLTQRLRPQTLH